MNPSLQGSFDLVFRPSLRLISVVRRFVQDFYQHLLDEDVSMQLALATHELLENAVKYGVDGETRLSIEVTNDEKSRVVKICTKNRTTPQHVEAVVALFTELNAASDRFAFYQLLMRRTANSPDRSGLGLARISVEADMDLSHELRGDELTIYARSTLNPSGGQA
jgi:hypothetical protein